jgi:hypothetical protein
VDGTLLSTSLIEKKKFNWTSKYSEPALDIQILNLSDFWDGYFQSNVRIK